MTMASPCMWHPPSPINTPAALQGEPPIWAVPTPSPSPMVRCPKEPRLEGDRGGGGGGGSGTESPLPQLVSQEILWEVCQPFVGQMLEALVKAIQQAQVEQLQAQRPQQSSIATERVSNTSSPNISKHEPDTFGGAFSCVFDVPKRGEPLRRLAEDDGEAGSASSSCPTPTTGQVHPQKVTCSSKESSPVNQGKEPSFPLLLGATATNSGSGSEGHSNSSMPQKVHSPSMPEISEKHLPTDVVPMYLSWQQQHHAHPGYPPGQHFPPGHPGAAGAQRWADQRLSPTVSPMAPMASPPSEGSGTTQLVLSIERKGKGGLEDTSSPEAPTVGSVDKSVMVCRHWKSKGYCKLDAACKFLHPEHKKGPAPPPAKVGATSSGSPQNPSTGSETSPGATAGTSTAKRSRRSGRNRNSGSAASSSLQAVAVGPIGNTIGAPPSGST